jgi:hypothetical protein
LLWDMMLHQW